MFVWDPRKAAENRRKHGVTFEDAARAFDDMIAVEWIDDREVYQEERRNLVGMVDGALLFVVFTEPDEETTRIISARKAERLEQDLYYRQETP